MLDDIDIQVPEKPEYNLLPEDVYLVEITNLEKKEKQAYASQEMETVILFTFTITEGEFEGQKLFKDASPKLFAGASGTNSSNLYKILSTATQKDYSEEELKNVKKEQIEELKNKKLKIIVKHYKNKDNETRHKVSDFMKAGKVEESKNEDPDEIDVKDIPF